MNARRTAAQFSADDLLPVLRASRDGAPARGYLIAYSGGLDSTVLLHAMHALRTRLPAPRQRAVHVNHGLQSESAGWAAHCARAAAALETPFECVRVNVAVAPGASHEAAAREARYRALASRLGRGELLLTAHHADDQLETVLLALLRGAGPDGLAGMPLAARFGPGWHVRPLLPYTREALASYAAERSLAFVEDPSNRDRRHARNYLRHELVPKLRARWPAVARTVTRSAALAAEAGQLLRELAEADLERLSDRDRLPVPALAGLSEARARNLLRHWVRSRGLPIPSHKKLEQVLREVLPARPSAAPALTWPGAELRRYRERLYLMAPLPPPPEPGLRQALELDQPACPGPGLGELRLVPAHGEGLSARALAGVDVQIGFRAGGEQIKPAGQRHTRSLKTLFQEHGVPPWMRSRIPLIFVQQRLAAVAGLWLAEDYAARGSEAGFRIQWRDHPALD